VVSIKRELKVEEAFEMPTSSHSGKATLTAKKQGSKAEVFSVLYLSLARMPRQPDPACLYN
jgi:hypothetical protein